MSNVSHLLDRHVADHPDAPAITQRVRGRNTTITYAQLDRRVCAEALRYSKVGLTAGSRVLVLCPVSIDLYVAVLALLRCGLTAMFVDPGAGLRRLDTCCRTASPQAVIASSRGWLLRPLVSSLRLGPIWLSTSRGNGDALAQCDPVKVGADHPAILTFTSGSTSEPRGAVRTHGFLALQQLAVARDLDLAARQCSLTTMPIFVLANLAAGVHSLLSDADLGRLGVSDARRLTQAIASHRPDRILASPAVLHRLAEYCQTHCLTLESLRRVDTGGAPVFPRTLDSLRRVMPRARLMVIYGSTEAEPIAMRDATRPDTALRQRIRQGSGLPVGALAEDLKVRLLALSWNAPSGPIPTAEFDAHCVGRQDLGEIIVQGSRVLGGYLDGAGDEQAKLHVAGQIWHRTGDLGRFDASGQLWLLGRAAAQLHDSRGTAEPLAVEAAAMEDPSIVRCALIGVAGQRVLAVELARSPSRGWHEALLQRLDWARLDRLMPVRCIPVDRRHHAKIDYPALRRLVGADAPRSLTTTRTVPAAPSSSTTSPS